MAARELKRAGRRVLVLEASRRVGGRILTRHDTHAGMPIELGAEFVHGEAPETTKLLEEARLNTFPTLGEHYRSDRGEMSPQGPLWERMSLVFRHLNVDRKVDRSFQDFLDTKPGGRSLWRERELTRGFIQGFNGAHTSLISEKSIAQQGDPTEGAADARRIVGGYGALIDHLKKELTAEIRLGVRVAQIEWSESGVNVVDARRVKRSARAVVIAVPLPMLQDASILFDPEVPAMRKAARQLMMGQVTRVTVVLKERFWKNKLNELSFVHSPERPFSVWWTQYPLMASTITGWAGGPSSIEISDSGDVESIAIMELARVFNIKRRRLEMLVASIHTHDWRKDRFIRGGYSYPGVGGTSAPRVLARTVGGRVFFAGEATESSTSGTVEGAISSGKRAAHSILDVSE
jgi:monoamine oxidase